MIDAGRQQESEKRTTLALILSPLLLSLLLAGTTVGLTAWYVHRAKNSPSAVSPFDLLALVFYLLVVVTVIRLICFAAVLLSASRTDEAVDLMPAIQLKRRLLGRLSNPSTTDCKRIGASVLIEAFFLLSTWLLCVVRLFHLS